MALTEKQEIRDLLAAARATRNYCMLTGRSREASEKLIDALEPFDGSLAKLNAGHLSTLRKALRDVCQGIDDYTLTQILSGEPPVRIGKPTVSTRAPEGASEDEPRWRTTLRHLSGWTRYYWPSVWQRFLLPGLAVILLLSAIHYTQWSFNANLILTRLDRHVEIDFHEEVRDLLVVARAIDGNFTGKEKEASEKELSIDELMAGTPAQRQFNHAISRIDRLPL